MNLFRSFFFLFCEAGDELFYFLPANLGKFLYSYHKYGIKMPILGYCLYFFKHLSL